MIVDANRIVVLTGKNAIENHVEYTFGEGAAVGSYVLVANELLPMLREHADRGLIPATLRIVGDHYGRYVVCEIVSMEPGSIAPVEVK